MNKLWRTNRFDITYSVAGISRRYNILRETVLRGWRSNAALRNTRQVQERAGEVRSWREVRGRSDISQSLSGGYLGSAFSLPNAKLSHLGTAGWSLFSSRPRRPCLVPVWPDYCQAAKHGSVPRSSDVTPPAFPTKIPPAEDRVKF